MAVDKLSAKIKFEQRSIEAPYTVSNSGTFNYNIYTAINNDMPSGYTFLGITGYTTNDQNVLLMSIRYANSAYSLQGRSFYSGSITNKVNVYYLCAKLQ